MEITWRFEAETAVLTLIGELTFGDGERAFLDQVQGVLADGVHRIVVDMGEVKFVDSSGLGALIRAHTSAARQGGWLRLVRAAPQLRSLLAIARLDDVLDVYDSLNQALTDAAEAGGRPGLAY